MIVFFAQLLFLLYSDNILLIFVKMICLITKFSAIYLLKPQILSIHFKKIFFVQLISYYYFGIEILYNGDRVFYRCLWSFYFFVILYCLVFNHFFAVYNAFQQIHVRYFHFFRHRSGRRIIDWKAGNVKTG